MIEVKGKFTTANVMIDTVDESTMRQITLMTNHPAATNPVVIMPDCHAGSGCVIGFTMRMSDKIVPNWVGVDIGCFTGNTKVALADGRNISFVDLIKEHTEGKTNFCYSVDDEANVVLAKIEHPRLTRVVNKLMRITLDNGEIIECTTDHIFYDRNNNEVRADDLTPGCSLMPLYVKPAKEVPVKNRSYRNKRNKLEDYAVVYNPSTQLFDYVHFLADDWNRENGVYKNKGIRHHIDFNKLNNNPTNIEILSWKKHWKIHSDHVSENNRLGICGFKAARRKNPEFFAKMASRNLKKTWKNPEFKKKVAVAAKENLQRFNDSPEGKKHVNEAGQRNRSFLIAFNKSKKKYACRYCGRSVRGKGALARHETVHKKNHKVALVEHVCRPGTPVYCLTVDGTHNFALSSGVFVHNCGMLSVNIGQLSFSDATLAKLDREIRNRVPLGKAVLPADNKSVKKRLPVLSYRTEEDIEKIISRVGMKDGRFWNSIGTLGGGNHFIEFGTDEAGETWVTIHTGSRNFGKRVCEYHDEKAQKSLQFDSHTFAKILKERAETGEIKYSDIGPLLQTEAAKLKHDFDTKESAYLTGDLLKEYIAHMGLAQHYANLNRDTIMKAILSSISDVTGTPVSRKDWVETTHNYISLTDNIIRKGAVSSILRHKMVIPFNMRDGLLICEGKSNPDWNYSAPHGAGRVLSRSKAKEQIPLVEYEETMKGIFTTSVSQSTIDESPFAYKDAALIEKLIAPTAMILRRVKPIYNLKAGE